ncbi:C40 family peptidase [Phragmitibacter flavus]|nr:NlpC/P60 family protein [Phragmitibacter flavus]
MTPCLLFRILVVAGLTVPMGVVAQTVKVEKEPVKPAAVSSMTAEELAGFEGYSPELQSLVRKALDLTKLNLRYQFGSAEPKAGGMDCSGAIYYLLRDSGVKSVPRQSDEICRWVMRRGVLYRTENVGALDETPFKALKPGDLLFWTGTYETSTPRELPISHVMMYLGKRKKDGKAVVFGASDGRSYEGQRRNGVSVFDFALPQRAAKSEFFGYGAIPKI